MQCCVRSFLEFRFFFLLFSFFCFHSLHFSENEVKFETKRCFVVSSIFLLRFPFPSLLSLSFVFLSSVHNPLPISLSLFRSHSLLHITVPVRIIFLSFSWRQNPSTYRSLYLSLSVSRFRISLQFQFLHCMCDRCRFRSCIITSFCIRCMLNNIFDCCNNSRLFRCFGKL